MYPNHRWQADLIYMPQYKGFNKGNKWVLIIVDVFTRRLFGEPLKHKSEEEMTKIFTKLFKIANPDQLDTDNGKEFLNKGVKALITKYKIEHNVNQPGDHQAQGLVERANQTVKNKLYKHMTFNESKNWVDELPKVIEELNNTVHKSTGMKPNDVDFKNYQKVLKYTEKENKVIIKSNVKVGDEVRYLLNRDIYNRGYTPNYSKEVYKVKGINGMNVSPLQTI